MSKGHGQRIELGGIRGCTVEGMPALPPIPRVGRSRSSQPVRNTEIDRGVQWRADGETGDTTGWCARCGGQFRAVELRLRPTRILFGKEVQESWECRGCNPKVGKYEVLGVRLR